MPIEDIFQEVDGERPPSGSSAPPSQQAPQPGTTKSVARLQPFQPVPQGSRPTGGGGHRYRLLLMVFGGILLLMAGTAFVVTRLGTPADEAATNTTGPDGSSGGTNAAGTDTPGTVPTVNQRQDTDGDGLTDEEETTHGTDPAKPDSDGDGLYDREELQVYKTDPLRRDSDGDGNSDGAEVANGYNPAGPGKLLIADELPD